MCKHADADIFIADYFLIFDYEIISLRDDGDGAGDALDYAKMMYLDDVDYFHWWWELSHAAFDTPSFPSSMHIFDDASFHFDIYAYWLFRHILRRRWCRFHIIVATVPGRWPLIISLMMWWWCAPGRWCTCGESFLMKYFHVIIDCKIFSMYFSTFRCADISMPPMPMIFSPTRRFSAVSHLRQTLMLCEIFSMRLRHLGHMRHWLFHSPPMYVKYASITM